MITVYKQYKSIRLGIHLFEDEEGTDWRKLTSPLPATYTAPGYETPQSVKEILAVLEEAKIQEIKDEMQDKALN